MTAVDIQLLGIKKSFHHRVKGIVRAVDDVSLTVEPGELFTLLGPSGCGKTTALRIIAGFENPDEGKILIAGRDMTSLMANSRNIGFVFQNYALFPHLTIHENVSYGLKVKRFSKAEIDKAVTEVLEMVGLRGYEHQFPHQISGGEQQRVALARAVVIQPNVLLFDEPLSNLDAKLRIYTRGEIRRLQQRLKITSIYVTHDQEEAMAISDRVVVMNQGKIVQAGSAEDLYFTPKTEFVAGFIGRMNALPGSVQIIQDNTVRVELFNHTYRIPLLDPELARAENLKAFIRPEFVNLHPGPTEGDFQGIVAERSFLGEKTEYLLLAGETRLTAVAYHASSGEAYLPGQKIGISLQEENIILLRNGGNK